MPNMKSQIKLIDSNALESVIENITKKLNSYQHKTSNIEVKHAGILASYVEMGFEQNSVTFYKNRNGIIEYSRPVLFKNASGNLYLQIGNKVKPVTEETLKPTGFQTSTAFVEFNNSGLLIKVQGLQANANTNPESWKNLFSTSAWLEMVADLPPIKINLPTGFYKVVETNDNSMRVEGCDSWFSKQDSCRKPNTLVKGDWVAVLYNPFISDTGELVHFYRSYKVLNERSIKGLDLSDVDKVSGLFTRIAGQSISTYLRTIYRQEHPEFGEAPLDGQTIHFPEHERYYFEWIGINQGLRFNGTDEQQGDIVLLKHQGQMIAVGATKSLKDLAPVHDHLIHVKVQSASNFNGKWFVRFAPILGEMSVWENEYTFDEYGEMTSQNKLEASNIQQVDMTTVIDYDGIEQPESLEFEVLSNGEEKVASTMDF